mmetsp:Transcript_56381/g.127921  ORF Transcript_56381/g.127921 Transcript_56381/m.127921 type:complete len:234 (-) Transcript_56381:160-861(-)
MVTRGQDRRARPFWVFWVVEARRPSRQAALFCSPAGKLPCPREGARAHDQRVVGREHGLGDQSAHGLEPPLQLLVVREGAAQRPRPRLGRLLARKHARRRAAAPARACGLEKDPSHEVGDLGFAERRVGCASVPAHAHPGARLGAKRKRRERNSPAAGGPEQRAVVNPGTPPEGEHARRGCQRPDKGSDKGRRASAGRRGPEEPARLRGLSREGEARREEDLLPPQEGEGEAP